MSKIILKNHAGYSWPAPIVWEVASRGDCPWERVLKTMDTSLYNGQGGSMNEGQWQAMYQYISNWLNMVSVACVAVGFFEIEHAFGGLIGATVCGLAGLVLKIWSKK